jgi:hypothetical protein
MSGVLRGAYAPEKPATIRYFKALLFIRTKNFER